MSGPQARHAIVVGAGWAGLAAAVRLVQQGHRVTVLDMAPRVGGRARSVPLGGDMLDNGQHILIGAYTQTLALMDTVGAEAAVLLRRLPLTLRQPGRAGLCLPPGPPVPAFVRGVLNCTDWTWRERFALLTTAASWMIQGFRCAPATTVEQLCARLPTRVRNDLIDPLCVAALNTPSSDASAAVLLRVLRDALFSGAGAADLLLPAAPLDRLLPEPASDWLRTHGATITTARRVERVSPITGRDPLDPAAARWQVDDEPAHAVVLAASATESARLTREVVPSWSALAASLAYEPIVTVYVDGLGAALECPMLALPADPQRRPAQFVFDLGQLGGPDGRLAFVISGAADWVTQGRAAIAAATLAQARDLWPHAAWTASLSVRHVLIEKRATFRCTPGLQRPPPRVALGLWAAGDHVEGPYPATLEGAVRSGQQAADGVQAEARIKLPLC